VKGHFFFAVTNLPFLQKKQESPFSSFGMPCARSHALLRESAPFF
jgi:hypothetical protein